ncbi:MAG: HAD family phosphatase [Acidobacteria bacterium]|nr:HAD family phosphatase [Acidobacteriota bacterium]
MSPLLGVIFDFDGVIADTERLHLRAFQHVLAGGPMTLTEEAYDARYLGYDDAGVFEALAADQGRPLPRREIERMVAAKGRRYDDLVGAGEVVFPDAPDCIARLSADLILGIASGALHGEIDAVLEAAGLHRHFAAVVAADDVERSKPAPDSYLRAVELLSAALGRPPSPSGFVAIEDSRWGIEAATAAGLRCVGITTSYGPEALPGAALVVSRLAEVDREALAAVCGQ